MNHLGKLANPHFQNKYVGRGHDISGERKRTLGSDLPKGFKFETYHLPSLPHPALKHGSPVFYPTRNADQSNSCLGVAPFVQFFGELVFSMFLLVLSEDRSEERNQGQDFLPLLSSSEAAPEGAFPEGLAVGFPSFCP